MLAVAVDAAAVLDVATAAATGGGALSRVSMRSIATFSRAMSASAAVVRAARILAAGAREQQTRIDHVGSGVAVATGGGQTIEFRAGLLERRRQGALTLGEAAGSGLRPVARRGRQREAEREKVARVHD